MNKEVGILLKVGQTGLENIDKATRELQGLGVETTSLDAKAAALATELKRLGAEQALIDSFKRTKVAVADAGGAMAATKDIASTLGREMAQIEAPTKAQEKAFAAARAEARLAAAAFQAQQLALQALRTQMAAAGVSTDSLAAAQVRVKAEVAQAQQELQATAGWAQRMATAERAAATESTALAGASRQAAGALAAQGGAAQQSGKQLQGVSDSLGSIAKIGVAGILGSQTAQLLKGVAETADAYANLQARIKLVTGEGDAFRAAWAGVAEVALRTNSNLEATGNLFSKIAEAGKQMGVSQEQALALTATINQAVQLSGASAQASDAAVTQLIQSLQSGVLRGDEFNSVMEQAPRLASALAKGLNVTTGELRKMAEAGELSAETVIKSLQTQSAVLEKEFGSLPATVGRAVENLSTKWTLFVGNLNASNGATASVAAGINVLADNLNTVAGVAERAGSVIAAALAVQGVIALRSFAAEMLATGAASSLLTADLSKIPKTINIAVAVVGFEAGYELGKVLLENSELARKLGIVVAAYTTEVVNGMRALTEAAAAVFNSDTVKAAFDRWEARRKQANDSYRDMLKEAEQSPELIRLAAAAAGDETKALGDKAQVAGVKVATAGAAGAAGMQGAASAAADAKSAIVALTDATVIASRTAPVFTATMGEQAAALVKVALSGRKAADMFRTELPEAIAKLSGPELEAFRVNMTQALGQAQDAARRLADELGTGTTKGAIALGKAQQAADLLQTVLVQVGTQAAQSLGVDVAGASSKVSKEFIAANENLATLVKSLPALKAAGVDTGVVVGQALAKMIDGAKNQAEINEIIARVKALGITGRISGQEMAGAFDLARDKALALKAALEGATPGVQSLAEAARKAGVETELLTTGVRKGFVDALQPVSDLVNQIISTGVESARASPVLAEAFDKRIQAAATKEEMALLTAEIVRARNAGYDFGGALSAELDRAKEKTEALNPVMAALRAEAKRLGVELAGISNTKPNPSYPTAGGGGRGSNGYDQASNAPASGIGGDGSFADRAAASHADFLRQQGTAVDASYQFALRDRLQKGDKFAESERPAIENALRVAKENARAITGSSVQSLVGNADAAQWVAVLQRVLDSVPSATPTAAPSGNSVTTQAPQVSASNGRTITLQLGGNSTTFTVGSAAEAASLESFLRNLETAAARAGG